MTYSLHRGAADDVAEAARFYRREGGRALAIRFVNEFERVAKLVSKNPGLGTPTEDDRHWFPLYDFPYSIIYAPHEEGIRIFVVRHQHRDPEYASARG